MLPQMVMVMPAEAVCHSPFASASDSSAHNMPAVFRQRQSLLHNQAHLIFLLISGVQVLHILLRNVKIILHMGRHFRLLVKGFNMGFRLPDSAQVNVCEALPDDAYCLSWHAVRRNTFVLPIFVLARCFYPMTVTLWPGFNISSAKSVSSVTTFPPLALRPSSF